MKRLILALLLILVALPVGFRIAAHLRETETLTEALPDTGRLVETALGQVFVIERGPDDGPALLFAHGTAAWSGLWGPVLQAAGDAGYRAIAFDMPPFGFSERAADGDYARVRQAERVQALVEALDLRPIVVAHSFGAGAMIEAVMAAPREYSGLIVVGGAVGLGSHETGGAMPLPLRPMALRQAALSLTATNPLAMRPILNSMTYIDTGSTPDTVRLLLRPMRRAGTTAAMADWLPSLLVPPMDAQSTRPEAYAALSLPVTYIWGAEDSVTPLAQGQALAAATGDAPLLVMEGVGHIPQIEAPGAFLDVLLPAIAAMTPETAN